MNNVALILVEETGVEFYTVASTGESGIGISGLAILCGVSQQAISKLVKGVTTNKPTKRLEPFVGEDLDLTTNTGEKGKVRALKAEFCVEVIKYYAYQGNETAQYTLDKFAIAGFNSWVQSITGWHNPTQESQTAAKQTPPSKPTYLLPPTFMEADLATDDATYQYLKQLGQQEISRKFN